MRPPDIHQADLTAHDVNQAQHDDGQPKEAPYHPTDGTAGMVIEQENPKKDTPKHILLFSFLYCLWASVYFKWSVITKKSRGAKPERKQIQILLYHSLQNITSNRLLILIITYTNIIVTYYSFGDTAKK